MQYECENCGWSGDDPDESNDGEGTAVCPECNYPCTYDPDGWMED